MLVNCSKIRKVTSSVFIHPLFAFCRRSPQLVLRLYYVLHFRMSVDLSRTGLCPDLYIQARLSGLIVVCFVRFWVPDLPFPNARQLGHPFQWKNTLPWHLGPAAKVRILRFKNLPPFRHDPSLQIPRLRYSPGLAPTTRLNALLNEASDS